MSFGFEATEADYPGLGVGFSIANLSGCSLTSVASRSRDAANAARCAGAQGKFWEYHDLLYANQGGENSGTFTKERLKAFGTQLALDTTTFAACVDAGTHLGEALADLSDATGRGFSGTPTFLIGNQRLVGPPTLEALRAAIVAAGG